MNDTAERAVKLMDDFNQRFSTEEDGHQYALLSVAEYRKRFPEATKEQLSRDY